MTLQKKKTVSVSYIIRVIIAVALMFGFGLLPPIPGLEKLGMQILGIFLGLIFSWICIGFTWPSLLAGFGTLYLGIYDDPCCDSLRFWRGSDDLRHADPDLYPVFV